MFVTKKKHDERVQLLYAAIDNHANTVFKLTAENEKLKKQVKDLKLDALPKKKPAKKVDK